MGRGWPEKKQIGVELRREGSGCGERKGGKQRVGRTPEEEKQTEGWRGVMGVEKKLGKEGSPEDNRKEERGSLGAEERGKPPRGQRSRGSQEREMKQLEQAPEVGVYERRGWGLQGSVAALSTSPNSEDWWPLPDLEGWG